MIFLFVIMTTSFTIDPVVQELSQYVLDVVQGLLLCSRSLLLGLHAATKVIIIVVISHVGRYEHCLDRADGGRGSVTTGFSFIIGPLEEAS